MAADVEISRQPPRAGAQNQDILIADGQRLESAGHVQRRASAQIQPVFGPNRLHLRSEMFRIMIPVGGQRRRRLCQPVVVRPRAGGRMIQCRHACLIPAAAQSRRSIILFRRKV